MYVGSSILIPLQGDGYRYGNDVLLRNNCWYEVANTTFNVTSAVQQPVTFIDYVNDLVGGRLHHFYVFLHPTPDSNSTRNVTIRLEIWRPIYDGTQSPNYDEIFMKLAWQLTVTLEYDPAGVLYTVSRYFNGIDPTCLYVVIRLSYLSGVSYSQSPGTNTITYVVRYNFARRLRTYGWNIAGMLYDLLPHQGRTFFGSMRALDIMSAA